LSCGGVTKWHKIVSFAGRIGGCADDFGDDDDGSQRDEVNS
jgi:hypothetical protein